MGIINARGKKVRCVQEMMLKKVAPQREGWVIVALPAFEALKALLHLEGFTSQGLAKALGYSFPHMRRMLAGYDIFSDRLDMSLRAWIQARCPSLDADGMVDAIKEEAAVYRAERLKRGAVRRWEPKMLESKD